MPSKVIGILTAGGDCPGLNAAIRAVGKAAHQLDVQVIGFLDGFTGLVENRTVRLEPSRLSGILTSGGTILGTSRDKPHRMPLGDGSMVNMTPRAVANYDRLHLDTLVCLGGNGTQKNANRLAKKGLSIVTLPKTIDNDVAMTDITFGFDTALGIATEAIDRLHSTAHSHHRIIVVEVMGHKAGWLALGAGIAGGADVILIPEIPYDVNKVAEAILKRSRRGKHFSIVSVSEGAMSTADVSALKAAKKRKKKAKGKKEKKKAKAKLAKVKSKHLGNTLCLAKQLEKLTGLESRVTILGHLQRGGTPSAADRLLATRLGTTCAALIDQGIYGVMVASRAEKAEPVPLDQVAGKRKTVPLDHMWIDSARRVGTCLGD